jgi:RNA polymerase-binding transcription factor DksA
MSDTTTMRTTAEQRLRAMLERAEQQVRNLELGLVAMYADGDTSQEDQDATRQVVDAIRADVLRITRALHRIEIGTFGRCAACGATIPAERLDAIPDAERCGACA